MKLQTAQLHINHQKELPYEPYCRLGVKLLENSFAEKDTGIPVDIKLNMSQQCILTAKEAKNIRRVLAERGGR